VANDEVGGNWHVSDTALSKLVELCADICRRNGIPKLNFTGDKSGNLTMHKWFAPTACPGPYLASKFPYIAKEVNKRLGNAQTEYKSQNGASYRVRVSIPDLNIRKGPGTDYETIGRYTGKGVFTIVEEHVGSGASMWGRLKSGAGWISLDYAAKL
jgi:hypothetical protein